MATDSHDRYQQFLNWEREQERKANEAKALAKQEAALPQTTAATERARTIPMRQMKEESAAMQAAGRAAVRVEGEVVASPPGLGVGADGRCRGCALAAQVVAREHPGLDTRWGIPTDTPNVGTLHAYDSQSGDPYHLRFGRELAWLRCWDQPDAPPLVYVAHPVAGDFRANIREARAWLRWLRRLTLDDIRMRLGFLDIAALPSFHAPWLVEPEDIDGDSRKRKRLLAACAAVASRFDEVWALVRWSNGVATESRAARRVRDLTHLGPTPPEWGGRR